MALPCRPLHPPSPAALAVPAAPLCPALVPLGRFELLKSTCVVSVQLLEKANVLASLNAPELPRPAQLGLPSSLPYWDLAPEGS